MRQIKPTGAGRLDVGQNFLGSTPRSFPRKLQMRYLCPHLRFTRDAEHFVQGRKNTRVLMPHVTGVDAIVRGHGFG